MKDQFRLMRLRRTSSKLMAGAMLMLAASGTAVGLTAAPASADPGSCGVRVDSYPAGDLQYNYIVRNKCARAYNWAVILPSASKQAYPGCQTLQGGETKTYWSVIADGNWYISLC
jgi:uncharacterized protein YbjQ (UPF0145 family)